MRKWASLVLFIFMFAVPTIVGAQGESGFGEFSVQLLPEYDQASMLVIYDFNLADTANVPTSLNIKIPADANLFAVAYNENGSLINAGYSGPVVQGDWQVVTIKTSGLTIYRIEYYEPLLKTDVKRQFTYLWPGDYSVKSFNIFLGTPLDVTQITTDPVMDATQRSDGTPGFGKNFGSLITGQQFTLKLQYEKTSDTLAQPSQEVQPASPVDASTPGRVSLTNYLPYIFGGLGFILIVGGFAYYWQSGRKRSGKPRRRHSIQADDEGSGEEMYCHQCGTRAKPSDRFCHVCGARLRQDS